uniref:Uncharacterized protein n=1 Tax=Leersia perrieri TaxID=77586 RepID=A0A0D9XRE6_9ORYZ
MESKEDKILVEINDSDAETFFCAICTEYKLKRSRSRCQVNVCWGAISLFVALSRGVLLASLPMNPGTSMSWVICAMLGQLQCLLRDASILRCGSCGQFPEGVTVERMEGVGDEHLDAFQRLAIMRCWKPCPNCGIFIENIGGGCSMIS